MVRKILFVVSNLDCGGINRALENLLLMWNSNCVIDVLALDNTGQYHKGFDNSNLLKSPILVDYQVRNLKNQKGLTKCGCALYKILNRILKNSIYNRATRQLQQHISEENYDTVIAFSEGLPTSFTSRIKAKRKLAWIHCDYKSYLSFNPSMKAKEERIYEQFDKIFCVSDFTRRSFIDVFPTFLAKTDFVYNILDTEMMKQKSLEFEVSEYGVTTFNIVTVGRIDPIKSPSRIPQIASKIMNQNYKWFIIGPIIWESEYQRLISEIKRFGLEEKIILLGGKNNPYPYIKQAALLVNTSRSEACPYVINEAKILGTPVICTDFGSAHEFINQGKNGFSLPVDLIGEKINELMNNQAIYKNLKMEMAKFKYDNNSILAQISQSIL